MREHLVSYNAQVGSYDVRHSRATYPAINDNTVATLEGYVFCCISIVQSKDQGAAVRRYDSTYVHPPVARRSPAHQPLMTRPLEEARRKAVVFFVLPPGEDVGQVRSGNALVGRGEDAPRGGRMRGDLVPRGVYGLPITRERTMRRLTRKGAREKGGACERHSRSGGGRDVGRVLQPPLDLQARHACVHEALDLVKTA